MENRYLPSQSASSSITSADCIRSCTILNDIRIPPSIGDTSGYTLPIYIHVSSPTTQRSFNRIIGIEHLFPVLYSQISFRGLTYSVLDWELTSGLSFFDIPLPGTPSMNSISKPETKAARVAISRLSLLSGIDNTNIF